MANVTQSQKRNYINTCVLLVNSFFYLTLVCSRPRECPISCTATYQEERIWIRFSKEVCWKIRFVDPRSFPEKRGAIKSKICCVCSATLLQLRSLTKKKFKKKLKMSTTFFLDNFLIKIKSLMFELVAWYLVYYTCVKLIPAYEPRVQFSSSSKCMSPDISPFIIETNNC